MNALPLARDEPPSLPLWLVPCGFDASARPNARAPVGPTAHDESESARRLAERASMGPSAIAPAAQRPALRPSRSAASALPAGDMAYPASARAPSALKSWCAQRFSSAASRTTCLQR